MQQDEINEYAVLFKNVFNGEPWNDKWTLETASRRITDMMNTSTFLGMAIYMEKELAGIIFGQEEQWYNGLHFQIQEFCIDKKHQGKGLGSRLLDVFIEELGKKEIFQIYLHTSKGQSTEGFYRGRGFMTSEDMVLMYK